MTELEMFEFLWPYYENLFPEDRPDIAFMHEVRAKLDNGGALSDEDKIKAYQLYRMSSVRGARRVQSPSS